MDMKRRNFFIVLLLFFFVFGEPLFRPFLNIAHAATSYYVNVNTGINSNNGSAGSPWKTITYALTDAGKRAFKVAKSRFVRIFMDIL